MENIQELSMETNGPPMNNMNGGHQNLAFPARFSAPAQQGIPQSGRPTGAPAGELWIETKTAEGKSYYYNAVTRQTTWTKPTGPLVQVMTQMEVENMSKQQQMQKREGMPSIGMPPPFGAAMPTSTGPGSSMPSSVPPGIGIPPPFFGAPPPFGLPPPNFPPQPQTAFPWGNIHPTQWLAIKKEDDTEIDPSLLARAAEWTEHKAPDGRSYFYNAARNESVWERPEVMRELEEAKISAAQRKQAMTSTKSSVNSALDPINEKLIAQNSVTFDSLGFSNNQKMDEEERKRKIEVEKKKKEQEEKAKQKPQDKSRPISSTPISGTPWCVVWTGDGRVFFYNPSSKQSIWEKPKELENRADVDKAVRTPPEQLLGIVNKHTISNEPQKIEDLNLTKKRSESESSSDNETNKKRQKIETSSGNGGKVEEAVDAEMKAAKERALVPLEQRIKQFKEMLREKDVSAFSTWEKELHKIVFDPRYLLLTSRERKQVFEKYVKDRAEEERREKRNKLRQKRDDFRNLMEDCNLHGKSNFGDFAQKFGKDERFKGIEKIRERESLFNEYLIEVRKREKEEKIQKREQIRHDFLSLLRENGIDRHQRWSDVKKKIDDKDPRYKAVGDSITREEYFHDYCKVLKDEKRKKDKEKKDKKKSKDRDRSRDRKYSKTPDKEEQHKSSELDTKIDSDKEDGEHIDTDDEKIIEKETKKKEERQKRTAEEAIKEREKEVQRALADQMRDIDKEREIHKREEASRHFSALLADLVKNPDFTWKDAKKVLKKDSRYEFVEILNREEREQYFNEHIDQLTKKKKDKFREMLDELSNIQLTSAWKDVKKQIRDDSRYVKYSTSSEKCEREFKEYIKDKTIMAKAAFRELLYETKLLTHKSLETLRENPNYLKEIEEILRNDKRYLVLDHLPEERTEMTRSHLEDLQKRGPPPPPTATKKV